MRGPNDPRARGLLDTEVRGVIVAPSTHNQYQCLGPLLKHWESISDRRSPFWQSVSVYLVPSTVRPSHGAGGGGHGHSCSSKGLPERHHAVHLNSNQNKIKNRVTGGKLFGEGVRLKDDTGPGGGEQIRGSRNNTRI